MPSIEELSGLLERVKAANGPDRELDAYIRALTDGRTVRENMHPQFGRQLLARNSRPPHDEYWLDHPTSANPAYTASLDAITALIERQLPGWRISFEAKDGIADDCYLIGPEYDDSRPELNSSRPFGFMPTAVALCCAFLSAKISQAKS